MYMDRGIVLVLRCDFVERKMHVLRPPFNNERLSKEPPLAEYECSWPYPGDENSVGNWRGERCLSASPLLQIEMDNYLFYRL